MEVVGEAESGLQVVDQVVRLKPDLVVLDLEMPGMHGLEAIRKLRNVNPAPAFIVVTARAPRYSEDVDFLIVDHLFKPVSPAHLAHPIELVRRKSDTPIPIRLE